jgi:type 2A phosphatase activator TIP41
LIDVIPKDVQVQQAGFWKNKDTSKIKDYKEVTQTSDWTFSTPYKGTVRYLSKAAKKVRDETSLELDVDAKAECDHISVVQMPEAAIPFEMLGPENPIVHFGEVYLFESDLEDCGSTMSKIRFRIMDNCFYILLRYYLRVDGVRVRVFDTRIFHEFGQDFIHREFQYRESNYDELRKNGFEFEPDWMINPN